MNFKQPNRSIVFLFFFLSGFCSLVYQLIWLRLVFSHFGVITPNISIVLSVFMAGLALGSMGVARFLPTIRRKTGSAPLALYALAETFIGLGAIAVPIFLRQAEIFLLSIGEFNSALFLILSGVLIALILLPWCVCMGATIPLMMAFVNEQEKPDQQIFSFLYLANIIGATVGTVFASVVMIELFGVQATSFFAGFLNFSIALLALGLSRSIVNRDGRKFPPIQKPIMHEASDSEFPAKLSYFFIFSTGFVSLGQEVALTRIFTPLFGTSAYAFAAVLSVYLLFTGLGTFLSRHITWSKNKTQIQFVAAFLPFTALLPIIFSDVSFTTHPWILLSSVFPFFAMLGFVTPRLVDRISGGSPSIAGRLYGLNLIGCILGPLVVGYLILPILGAKFSLLLLALLLIPFAFVYGRSLAWEWKASLAGFLITAIFLSAIVHSIEDGPIVKNGTKEVRRDFTATVVSFGEGFGKRLYVNGVGITFLTNLTKLMAHLPLAYLNRPPQSALVICFGMGATYRSLLSWDIDVTAVELVPSVVAAFGYYFPDAEEILKNPRGHIIVDDGRRFLQRTNKKFDVITIDPPPPVEAASSSLLYSTEFYQLASLRLTKDGVLQQWYPGGELAIARAIANSLVVSFPYVRAYQSYIGAGLHFVASNQPIITPTENDWMTRLPQRAQQDLLEWNKQVKLEEVYRVVFSKEISIPHLLGNDPKDLITDDRPFNEYFALRRLRAYLKTYSMPNK